MNDMHGHANDEPGSDEEDGWIEALKRRAAVPIGIVGLLAWFALLWFMFGDVL